LEKLKDLGVQKAAQELSERDKQIRDAENSAAEFPIRKLLYEARLIANISVTPTIKMVSDFVT